MKRGNRLRRIALLLALLVLAAIVTGVAASATKTVVPKQMTGRWGGGMVVGRRGKVTIHQGHWYQLKISHVTTHSGWGWLIISGMPSCSGKGSGTGTYGWYIHPHLAGGEWLSFNKVEDACKQRVNLLNIGGGFGPHHS
jgi:hypothetical protein